VTERVDEVFASAGCGVPVLHRLATTDGPQTVRELTDVLDAADRTVFDTLLKLQAHGYVDCRIRPRPGEDGDHPREWWIVELDAEHEQKAEANVGVEP